MERFSTCDLRDREVINLCDGTKLGCPTDFEFDFRDGKITAIIISLSNGFFHNNDIVIPWCKIECIGEDTILVKLSTEDYEKYLKHDKQKKRHLRW